MKDAKGLAIILSKMAPGKESKEKSEYEEEESDYAEEKEMAAEEVLSAIKDSDAKGLAEAMSSLVKLCK